MEDQHNRWDEHHEKLEIVVFSGAPTPYEAPSWVVTDDLEQAEKFCSLNTETIRYGIAQRIVTYGPWENIKPNTEKDWNTPTTTET